jgi:hypothetical protein
MPDVPIPKSSRRQDRKEKRDEEIKLKSSITPALAVGQNH